MNEKIINNVMNALGVAKSDFDRFYSLALTIDGYVIICANDRTPEITLERLRNNSLFRYAEEDEDGFTNYFFLDPGENKPCTTK